MAEANEQVQQPEMASEQYIDILYRLQQANSEHDRLLALLGDLPEEVRDLEDEIEGLHTRGKKLQAELDERTLRMTNMRHEIKENEAKIKKYKGQLETASNDREYDSLNKEIEYLGLDIDLHNKQIKDAKARNEVTTNELQSTQTHIDAKKVELEAKKEELDTLTASISKDLELLQQKADELKVQLPLRLQMGYERIRKNASDGRAVVPISRGACGGCWNQIPLQRTVDIQTSKKLIFCEYCGRIIVYDPVVEENESKISK
ncbi:MAG: zinc ribbon domain-containing protein [Bacteroides sp.]